MPRIEVSEHFATYTENNRIKHAILTKYLFAYLKALSNQATAFHYIDGFAGCGHYAGKPGSPLQAITLLSQQPRPYSVSFVEADPDVAKELREAVLERMPSPGMFDPPLIETGEFANQLAGILARPIYESHRGTATFAFVDPCRPSGFSTVDLKSILRKPYGECLVFWNYEGIIRWLGALSAEDCDGSELGRIFGGVDGLRKAREISMSARNPAEKERDLLSHFLQCTKESSAAKFLIPFRFNTETANRTGHYLIHCSNSALAFKIMKDVMGSLSSISDPGQFAFLGTSELGNQLSMLVPEAESLAEAAIRTELSKGMRPVGLFTNDWILRPHDFFRSSDYKRILLGMESEGILEVLAADGVKSKPAASRMRLGITTLGEKLLLRLRGHA